MKNPFPLASVLVLMAQFSSAALLGIYEFDGDPPDATVTSQPSGATFGSMTRNIVTYDSHDNRFSSRDWSHDLSVDLSKYVEFVVTPDAGQQLDLTQILFDAKRGGGGGGGPREARVSIFIGASTTPQESLDFAPTTSAFSQITFDFADFSSASAVTVRIYGWDVPASVNGPLAVDNIETHGSIVAAVPEPANRGLLCFAVAFLGSTLARRFWHRKNRSVSVELSPHPATLAHRVQQ